MSAGKVVTFVRVRAEVDWCNKSFRNKKGHIECCETHEEMAEPGRNIGFYCPAKEAIEEMEKRNETCRQR